MFGKDSRNKLLSTGNFIAVPYNKDSRSRRSGCLGQKASRPAAQESVGARKRVAADSVYSEMSFHLMINSLQLISAL